MKTQHVGSGSTAPHCGVPADARCAPADWRIVINQMREGLCDFAVPVSLNGIIRVGTFTDTGDGRSYCLLLEVRVHDQFLWSRRGLECVTRAPPVSSIQLREELGEGSKPSNRVCALGIG